MVHVETEKLKLCTVKCSLTAPAFGYTNEVKEDSSGEEQHNLKP
jgi:hypothetical protein